MQLESLKTSVQKNQEEVFDFLTKMENYEQLMPESNQRFEILSPESFLFQLQGMPEIHLELKETNAPEKIIFGSLGGKLPFTLIATIDSVSQEKSEVQLLFQGEFNAMMGMMIKGPIQKFINTLNENMASI